MTSIGANITIYCDLYLESLNNLLWRRYDYNGSNYLNLISTNIPSRYNITNTDINLSNKVSLLTITGVTSNDFATFECSSSTVAYANLTEARKFSFIPTTVIFLCIVRMIFNGDFLLYFKRLIKTTTGLFRN